MSNKGNCECKGCSYCLPSWSTTAVRCGVECDITLCFGCAAELHARKAPEAPADALSPAETAIAAEKALKELEKK